MAQEALLRSGQAVVTPIDQRSQGLVTREGRAAAGGQELETIVQAGGDLRQRQSLCPRGGQLQRKGYAIQPPADLCGRYHVRGVLQAESGLDFGNAVGQELE